MSHVYFIPGLGFDSRLFSKLHIKGEQLYNIDWIEPESDEPISEYAKRISRNILHEDATLIGHSFGGIISLEIANHIPVKNIFLISSISSPSEIPFSFKLISKLRLYYLVSPWILGNTIPIWGRFYDYTTKEYRQLVRSMILGNSRTYLNWALKALGNWNTKTAPAGVNIYVIHGSQDKTFPIQSLNKVSFRIKDGGHFMVYKHAEEISKFINEKMIVPVE